MKIDNTKNGRPAGTVATHSESDTNGTKNNLNKFPPDFNGLKGIFTEYARKIADHYETLDAVKPETTEDIEAMEEYYKKIVTVANSRTTKKALERLGIVKGEIVNFDKLGAVCRERLYSLIKDKICFELSGVVIHAETLRAVIRWCNRNGAAK